MTDKELVEQSRQLDADIVAIPRDKIFTKRAVVMGFLVIVLALGYLIQSVKDVTSSTNRAVRNQIADKDEIIDVQQHIIEQAADAINLLLDTLDEHNIKAPRLVFDTED